MVEYRTQHLDLVFHALADSTRREMLRNLAHREHTVSELAQPFDMSLAAASKHIKVLERAGLVRRVVEGRTHTCRIEGKPLADIHEWMRFYERFWNDRLDTLEELLRAEDRAIESESKNGVKRSASKKRQTRRTSKGT